MEYEGLAAVIADEINKRKRQKMEPIEKEIEKVAKEIIDDSEDSLKQLELEAQLKTIEENFVFHRWLTDAARLASGVSFSTHPIKFTHASAKGASSVYSCASQTRMPTDNNVYLSTANLHSPVIDVAYDDAKLSPYAKLLQLRFGDNSLADNISNGDFSPLEDFAQSQAQLEEWVRGFRLALSDKSLKSHTLAKQLYFPVGEQQYHLLSPLFSSSLSQAIFQRVINSRFGDEVKNVRDARKASKFIDKQDVNYLNTALQNFGGSKPQNISQLNSGRGGKSFLFSSAPPTWQSELKPPLNCKSIFSGEYDRRAWKQSQRFQQYLLSIQKLDSTMIIRRNIDAYLDELIDVLLNYAAEVQCMTHFAGWTNQDNPKLKRDQQLWLDPYRNDPLFQEERAKGDWQVRIADDFAFWLKRRLKHEQLVFGETEHQEWLRLLSRRLSEFEADLPEVSP